MGLGALEWTGVWNSTPMSDIHALVDHMPELFFQPPSIPPQVHHIYGAGQGDGGPGGETLRGGGQSIHLSLHLHPDLRNVENLPQT